MSKTFPLLAAWLSLGVLASVPAMAADPVNGAAVFKAQCSACHSPVAGKTVVGPSLFGVVGRTTGQVAGFRYSAPNKAAALTLDEATLDRYLTDPRAAIPGTFMTYAGLKDAPKRADLIAYLATLK